MLGILRHAKSDWDDAAKRDFDRGLNDRGRRGASLIGDHIRGYGMQWDRLFASPAERVKQTLESALPEIEPEWDKRLYLASAGAWTDFIASNAADDENILIAGHNPGLQELLFALVPQANENDLFFEAARKFPTAAFGVLELNIDSWAGLDEASGRLVHFARPRDLDETLGPDITV